MVVGFVICKTGLLHEGEEILEGPELVDGTLVGLQDSPDQV